MSERILVCLLSDQLVPNLLSIHHYEPDKLVFLVTTQMKDNSGAAKMLEALSLGGKKNFLSHKSTLVIKKDLPNEDSISETKKVLESVYCKFPSASWIVNLVGGTKPMSIAAYDFFKDKSATLIYTNVSKPNDILEVSNGNRIQKCEHHLSVREFLASYGIKVVTPIKNLEKKEARALKWWECSRTIAEHDPRFQCLTNRDRQIAARNEGILLVPSDFASLNEAVCSALIENLGLTAKCNAVEGCIDKYAANFLTGGWLEVFFFGLLKKLEDKLEISSIHLDVNLKKDKSANELDVVFMYNQSLHSIECKSGGQEHDEKFDVLYKTEAIKTSMKALRVKSYVATAAENIFEGGDIKESIRNRAEIYNCGILTWKDIQALAIHHTDASLIGKQFKLGGKNP